MNNFIAKDRLREGFIRKVDKSEIPTCNILGVNIAAVNMEWILNYLQKNTKSDSGNLLSGDYICVSNVHTTVTSYVESRYCSIQNNGLMAIPDGGPLATLGKKRGKKGMERIAGPSLMEEIFKVSVKNKYKHYFYGSTVETLGKLRLELEDNYPNIEIVGMYSPPFRPLTEEEDSEISGKINASNPDFIWIGLGAPKQEEWMASHLGKVKGLMIGVGAGFDYFAGNIKRAPNWMQSFNLEWLYRLFQEPKRLFKRYFYTNIMFIWHAVIKGK